MTDPAIGAKLAKEYDFRTMTDAEFQAEFTTKYMWERENIINGEHQFYVDPRKVPKEHNPFVLSPVGLSITAKPTPPDLVRTAIGLDEKGRSIGVKNLTPLEFDAHATPQPYISGAFTSRDNGHSQLLGYWEMSARLPRAGGAWPAFWLYPTFKSWPEGIGVLNEIDIMEATQEVINGIYHGSLHTNETGKMVHSTGNDITARANLVSEYHRYGLAWDPEYIVWYFDGEEVIRRKTPGDMLDEPRHFLLNLAVGSDKWDKVGQPVLEDYPVSFDIEYVRIYESNYVAPKPKETDPDSPALDNAIKVLELTTDYLRKLSEIV